MNIKIIYSYDGSKFCGSQKQPNLKSVEDSLQTTLNKLGIYEKLLSSSRTDKGVHAINQVSSVICPDFWEIKKLLNLLNKNAKPYINIKNIEVVSDSFHPRYNAKSRSYRYILNHNEYSPFLADYCYFYKSINLSLLNSALNKFIGIHDFSSFMKTGSETKSNIREIYRAYAYNHKNLTIIKFKANGFLRAQVRLMVANVLKQIDSKENFTIQKAITRTPAPPNGLYLERIFY